LPETREEGSKELELQGIAVAFEEPMALHVTAVACTGRAAAEEEEEEEDQQQQQQETRQ
jgi:hypothetical protein